MINSGFSVRQNQDSESVRSNCEAVHFRITVCLSTNRELKIYDVKAATTPQILHIYGTETKALHVLHVLFLFLYIAFPFSANLRREMAISQVL